MAKKKIKKPTYVPKEMRKKKNPMPTKTKIIIASVAGALLLGLILFLLLYNDGSLPVKGGVVQKDADNWLITNLSASGKRYYKQAEVDIPEGFSYDPSESLKSDSNETAFLIRPEEGTESNIEYAYISGSATSASEMADSVQPQFISFYGEENVSTVKTAQIGGIVGSYFTLYTEEEVAVESDAHAHDEEEEAAEEAAAEEEEAPADAEEVSAPAEGEAEAEAPDETEAPAEAEAEDEAETEAPAEAEAETEAEADAGDAEEAEEAEETEEVETVIERSMMITFYFPAYRNSSIVLSVVVHLEEGAPIPAEDELLALVEPFASGIRIEVPDNAN